VASILYLAKQIRHSTSIAQSQNHHEVTDAHIDYLMEFVNEPEVASLFLRGAKCETLSEEDQLRFLFLLAVILTQFQNSFYQDQARLIPKELWEHHERALMFWFQFPGVIAWWEGELGRNLLRQDFATHVDKLIVKLNNPPNAQH